MFITLTDTFDNEIEKAMKIAKENDLVVVLERDGIHGTDDLYVVYKFQSAGFSSHIRAIDSKHDNKALRVKFYYKKGNTEYKNTK